MTKCSASIKCRKYTSDATDCNCPDCGMYCCNGCNTPLTPKTRRHFDCLGCGCGFGESVRPDPAHVYRVDICGQTETGICCVACKRTVCATCRTESTLGPKHPKCRLSPDQQEAEARAQLVALNAELREQLTVLGKRVRELEERAGAAE
jgi:hypothetical protein